jgi:NTP pyrophosphatase (non-canonical NTP hydrolase)
MLPNISQKDQDITTEVLRELHQARNWHPRRFHSAHEGYAVIKEEVDELWDAIKNKNPDKAAIKKEAIQVAAMAIRFLSEVLE